MPDDLTTLLLALGSLGGPLHGPLGRLRLTRDIPDPAPLRVSCPRCHAQPGEGCVRAMLGGKPYHMSRLNAAKEPPCTK